MEARRGERADAFGLACTVPVTDQFGDRLAHQVFDLHIAPEGGALRTLCGEWIIPTSMMTPIGRPCATCEVKVASRAEKPDSRRHRWMWGRR
jgi:hypothetical protein